ncbi:MAG: divalent-cation tolerance protein CutA [Candidatus Aenigmarchaeota archaeon]|nr:divalent-cation tolerance protein CutA [Candidatus Aenigmarchaeota archaeon]MDW8149366.1 divalent-cation tolerance protein CutA [Candidatus Aenigmarchaeota archaeon]
MEYYLVYITCKNYKEANRLGKILLEEKLVACINIVKQVYSQYWWKGKIEKSKESILLLKCPEKNLDRVVKRVKELHSYSLPDISAIKINKGLKEFINWVNNFLS